MDIDAYRARAQEFATALGAAHLRRFAGLEPSWDPAAIYEGHSPLWDDAAIAVLREHGHRRLERFAVEARLGTRLAQLDAARARAEADEGLAELHAALRAEDDPRRRAELEERRLDAVTRTLSPLAARAVECVRADARTLGWPSARAMFSHLHGVDLGALAAEAQAILRRTAPPALPAWVGARHDLPRLQALHTAASRDHPAAGEAGDPVDRSGSGARLRRVLATLGLSMSFVIDLVDRPAKCARAFCAAVRVPEEVHVVAPGDDPSALFHESGHALHLAHRDAAAPFEDRHLVDRAQSEGIAFLFEQAAGRRDPELLALRLRRIAASLLHDLELLDEGPQPALADRYARRMAGATGLDWPRAPWLAGADPLLSSADYLRGLRLAEQLAVRLGGDGWWTRPAAGDELARILSAPA
jgi:hypothetical protein